MKKLGLIGHPVSHSMSQVMHTAVFNELGLDASYELFDVLKEDLAEFIGKAKGEFVGLNVTIPHKVDVIEYVDELSKEAELIGAVNTLKFEGDVVRGFNTDGIGCVKSLIEEGVEVKESNVLILGAGGAARAISYQCVLEGAKVSLSNREQEKQMAVDLANEINSKTGETVIVVDMDDESLINALKDVDVLINATPVGMHPNTESVVIPTSIIPDGVAVMDIVYNPVETKLIRDLSKRGLKTVSGVGMLVHQGAQALRIWLDIEPPVDLMMQEVLKKLAAKH
jgi:shikimate dehydrogenase